MPWPTDRAPQDFDDVLRFFDGFAAEALERTQNVVGAVPRVTSEPARAERPLMRLELVRDVPYTGYCDYLTNTMRMNADQSFMQDPLSMENT